MRAVGRRGVGALGTIVNIVYIVFINYFCFLRLGVFVPLC